MVRAGDLARLKPQSSRQHSVLRAGPPCSPPRRRPRPSRRPRLSRRRGKRRGEGVDRRAAHQEPLAGERLAREDTNRRVEPLRQTRRRSRPSCVSSKRPSPDCRTRAAARSSCSRRTLQSAGRRDARWRNRARGATRAAAARSLSSRRRQRRRGRALRRWPRPGAPCDVPRPCRWQPTGRTLKRAAAAA